MKTDSPLEREGGPHTVPATFTPGEPLLTCDKLVIGYNEKPMLPPIDMVIRRGQFVAVVGRNGSGKSTWFKTLLGMVEPLSGAINRKPQMRTAYVPQTSSIDGMLPLRARELTAWGRLRGWSFLWPIPRRTDTKAVENALDTAGARAIASRPYRELSEGQKQRALLARLIATEADMVLLDEPTAAMDAVAERETMQRLCSLARQRGLGVVVVCHDLEVAAEHADVLFFVDRETSAFVVGDARTVFCHPAFRRRYGDEYCQMAPEGPHRGNNAR